MTAVVGTLLNAWGIPRMNIRRVRASVLEGNAGSVRVFEKNEFVLQTTVRDCIRMVTTGRLHTLHVLELRR
jgi:RimJ/RimL family protein N-acetyltransferase